VQVIISASRVHLSNGIPCRLINIIAPSTRLVGAPTSPVLISSNPVGPLKKRNGLA
jgi:hypothetical protein